MGRVLGHHLILLAAVTALGAMSYLTGWPRDAEGRATETAAIIAVSQPTREPPTGAAPAVPVPRDMASLTREIQRELKRVGCYDGEESGRWDAQSRLAMKAFADGINSRLSVDRPDDTLLRLAQGHRGRACGANTALPAPPSLLREGLVPRGAPKVD
jgi:hypothetical protein